jgi:hypothetical protein
VRANCWTEAERAILKAHSISEARKLLPNRTEHAVRTQRTLMRVGPVRRPWSKSENRRIVKYGLEPLEKLARRFLQLLSMSLSPCCRFHPAEVSIRIGQSSAAHAAFALRLKARPSGILIFEATTRLPLLRPGDS